MKKFKLGKYYCKDCQKEEYFNAFGGVYYIVLVKCIKCKWIWWVSQEEYKKKVEDNINEIVKTQKYKYSRNTAFSKKNYNFGKSKIFNG